MAWSDEFMSSLNGNLTAVFSLLFDNLVNLLHISSSIISTKGASTLSSTVLSHLFLGSLSGVILGNIFIYIYTTRSSGSMKVCIPFGIDAPTVFFMGGAISNLYSVKIAKNLSPDDALEEAWGDAIMIIMIIGLVKLALTLLYCFWDFPSKIDQKIFGGCLAGIGIALLGMNNLIDIFSEPLSGLASLFVFLMVTLPPNEALGWRNKVPHFVWSVLVGVPIYYIVANLPFPSGAENPSFFFALPSVGFFGHIRWDSDLDTGYIISAIIYACLVFTGGYSVVKVALEDENAAHNVDDEPLLAFGEGANRQAASRSKVIRTILFADSVSTILTSLCGGLIQTTPYIGHSTYKELGARRDYSWMFAALLLLLTCSGTMSYISQALPDTVLKPVFVLIALQITQFAFGISVSEPIAVSFNKYIPALTMALFPSIAQLLLINGGGSNPAIVVLSSGFVITSVLWGQVTLSIINCNRMEAIQFFLALAFMSFFGFIHSYEGKVYYDVWDHSPYYATYATIGYFVCALLSFVFVPGASSSNANIINQV